MSQPRALVAYCPDWAVIAAGRQASREVAVVSANQVVATSPAARAAGARAGMRRREAQARCPGLEVLLSDLPAEARWWEPAVAAVETFAPGSRSAPTWPTCSRGSWGLPDISAVTRRWRPRWQPRSRR